MPTASMRYRVGITSLDVRPVKDRANFHRVAMDKGLTVVAMDITSDELVQLYEQLGDYITTQDGQSFAERTAQRVLDIRAARVRARKYPNPTTEEN